MGLEPQAKVYASTGKKGADIYPILDQLNSNLLV